MGRVNKLAAQILPVVQYMPTIPASVTSHVDALLLRCGQVTPEIIRLEIGLHYTPQAGRIPDLRPFLGDQSTVFYIRMHGMNQATNRPYRVFFKGFHNQGGDKIALVQTPNSCVQAITGGASRYPWYEDVVVVRCSGQREESFDNLHPINDLPNIVCFFRYQSLSR